MESKQIIDNMEKRLEYLRKRYLQEKSQERTQSKIAYRERWFELRDMLDRIRD